MSWKTDHEPTPLNFLSQHESALFSKLSPQGKEFAEKMMLADKKTRTKAAFQLILRLCWDGKDKKINKEQFFDIADALFNCLWLTASMETTKLLSEEGPESLAENLALLQIFGSKAVLANARQLQNLMEMLK